MEILAHTADGRPIRPTYDVIVCGAGPSGSVVAGRLTENPDVHVLLLEAGDSDISAAVTDAANWMHNIGSARDWCFSAEPNARLNDRVLHLAMGKGLGGGASMNGMMWSRGHRSDWDFFASESGDAGWAYDTVPKIHRRLEDWHGPSDPKRRGVGGPVFVQPLPDPPPIVAAKMGRDPSSVVDSRLRVQDIAGLTTADASVFPRITTGNTMAPCIVVGERASDILKADHGA